jgi:hypothetical protein
MRRLIHYSIRSLLVFITFACVALGWYVPNKREYDRQQLALDQLEQICVADEWEVAGRACAQIARRGDGRRAGCIYPFKWLIGFNNAELHYAGPAWLGNCLSWWNHPVTLRVTVLEITTAALDDTAIRHLVQLATLETLSIEKSRFTPEGEARLRRLLSDTTITLTPYDPGDGT